MGPSRHNYNTIGRGDHYKRYLDNGGNLDFAKYKTLLANISNLMIDELLRTGKAIQFPFLGELSIVKEEKISTARRHYKRAGFNEYYFFYYPYRQIKRNMRYYRSSSIIWNRKRYSKKSITNKVVAIQKEGHVFYLPKKIKKD